MSDYTYQDILRMQEEAKARVIEMRRRSRFLTEEPQARAIRMPVELPERGESNAECGMRNAELRQGAETVAAAAYPAAGTSARNAQRESAGLPAILRNVFGHLGEEETEKMFLLALCLLLSQENGDEGLLLAMMYLLT